MTNLLLLLLLSRFSRVRLCNPIDGSPTGFPIPRILQARILEWVAISFSNAWKWEVKVKLLSPVRLLATPWTAAYQAPPSMGFSRQEYWSGVLLHSPMTNLDSILKSRDITLPTKVCPVKAMVFPVVMDGSESCTIRKAECWRIDAFELWCWRRFLRVPCAAVHWVTKSLSNWTELILWASQVALVVKNLLANVGDARDTGSITGLGRSPGAGNDYPLQYSCLENSMDTRTWRGTIHGATKYQTQLSTSAFLTFPFYFLKSRPHWKTIFVKKHKVNVKM